MALSTNQYGSVVTARGEVGAIPAPIGNDVDWNLHDKIWKAVRSTRKKDKRADNRVNLTRHLMGGLDPDIACLQSLPYTTQVRMQVDRCMQEEVARDSLVARVAKMFGANPDDFV